MVLNSYRAVASVTSRLRKWDKIYYPRGGCRKPMSSSLFTQTEKIMNIKHIVLRKGQYYLYEDFAEKYLIAVLPQKEIGEMVGYSDKHLLCLQGNQYTVRSLQGEAEMSFYPYTNPYPMKIPFCIGDIKSCVQVENEEEESQWRKTIQQIKRLSGQTAEEKLKAIVKQLDETDSTTSPIDLYRLRGKDFSQFLKEAVKLYPPLGDH